MVGMLLRSLFAVPFAMLVFVPIAMGQDDDFESRLADLAPNLRPLVEALYTMSEDDLASAEYLYDSLASPEFTLEQWQEVFGAFLKDVPFLDIHRIFWNRTIEASQGQLRSRMIGFAGLFTFEAIAQTALANPVPPNVYERLNGPNNYLIYLVDGMDANTRATLFDRFWDAIKEPGAQRLATALRNGLDERTYPDYIQFGLTMSEFMQADIEDRRRIGTLMGQSDLLRGFWMSHAIFLFDEDGLTPQHVQSLDSLMGAIPSSLHGIGAFIFPETTTVEPGTASFATSIQILYLPIVPMGNLTDPGEFLRHVGQPAAPAFTIGAAEQITYAIQEVQFAKNPSLEVRRDSILLNAKGNFEAYVRRDQIVPVESYLNDPETFLPSLAVLWFIDSERTFLIGRDLFQLGMRPGMDSVLLLADLFSAGSNTAPMFRTDTSGRVSRDTCQIARTHVTEIRIPRTDRFNIGGPRQAADLYLPSGIKIGTLNYQFTLNEYGGVEALLPLHPIQ
jgi:hypothetical protein